MEATEVGQLPHREKLLYDADVTEVEGFQMIKINDKEGGVDSERVRRLEYWEMTLELRAEDADLTRESQLESTMGMALAWRTSTVQAARR